VSQGIQQIPKKKGVVQEIQQVGGGVSQGIQQIPKKKGVVQEIQQVGMVKGFL
jgi:adenosylmethionine-8-amino-7-oxononanoate aminotransferase